MTVSRTQRFTVVSERRLELSVLHAPEFAMSRRSPFHISATGQLLALFDHGELFCLLIGGMILLIVAKRVVGDRPRVRIWGLRVGVLSFVAWYVRDIRSHGLWGAEQVVVTGLRGLLVLLYVTCTSWLLISIAACVMNDVIGASHARLHARWRHLINWLNRAFSKRLANPISGSERPESDPKDRLDREEAASKVAEARKLAKQQQLRRDELRYELQLLYDRHRVELSESIPKERFDAYFEAHLTDTLEPDVYATRAEQLKEVIRERAGVLKRTKQPVFESIEDVIEHYRAKKQRLRLLDLDDDTLETLEVTLDDIQDREVRKLLA